jgi:hypothetical protein
MNTPFRLISYPTRKNKDGTPDFRKYITDTSLFNSSRRIRLDFGVANDYHNKLYRNTYINGNNGTIANYVPLQRSEITRQIDGPDIGYLNTRFIPFDAFRPRVDQNKNPGAFNPGILEDEADNTNASGKYISDYFAPKATPKANGNTNYASCISMPSSGVFDIVFVESIAHAKSVFGYFVYDKNDPPQSWSDFQKKTANADFVVLTPNTVSRRYLTLSEGNLYYDIYGLGNKEEDVYDGDMSPLDYGSLGVDVEDQGVEEKITNNSLGDTGLPPVGAYHASYRCIIPDTYVSKDGVYCIGDYLSFDNNSDDNIVKYFYCKDHNNNENTKELNVLDITKDDLADDWKTNCKCDLAICPFIIRDAWDTESKMMDMTPLNDAIKSGEPQDRLFTALPDLNVDGKYHMVRTCDKPIVSEVLQKKNNGGSMRNGQNNNQNAYERLTAKAYVYGMEDFKDDGSNPEFIDYNDFVFYVRDAEDDIDI